jgi:hypothetical protein
MVGAALATTEADQERRKSRSIRTPIGRSFLFYSPDVRPHVHMHRGRIRDQFPYESILQEAN